jgi:hypothetical protein
LDSYDKYEKCVSVGHLQDSILHKHTITLLNVYLEQSKHEMFLKRGLKGSSMLILQ